MNRGDKMIGKTLGNRYEIVEKIGGGGMALVYKAKCQLLNRYVAVKILRPEFTSDEEFIRNFGRESQAAASLSHPNIVNIYDVGNDDEIYYIVMEYVKGNTLKQIIKEKGSFEPDDTINVAKQIALALEHAHNNHIVHRDIKPHNILLTEDGRVKVTDFGIARAVTSSTVTNAGNVIGSVHYFSPEQARGGYTDEKSDLYSLGIVIYEMITGRVPFEGDSPISIALKHINNEIILPTIIKKNTPKAIEDIIIKATQKDQSRRYNSAREVLDDLNQALRFPMGSFVKFEEDDSPTQIIPAIKDEDIRYNTAAVGERLRAKKNNGKMIFWTAVISAFILAIIVTGTIFFFNDQLKGNEKEIPGVVGKTYEEAKTNIENLGLKINISSEQFNSQVEEGHIISQTPAAREIVKEGYTIQVIVSKGPQLVEVPNLINKRLDEIDMLLENESLKKVVKYEYHTLPVGIIISQNPKSRERVPKGSSVNIVVSQGEELKSILMSNLVGEEVNTAKRTLENSGLITGKTDYVFHSTVAKDIVLSQSIPQGTEVEENSVVDLIVSKGAENVGQPTEENELPMKSVSFRLKYDDAKQEEFIIKIVIIQNGVSTIYYSGVHQKSKSSQETLTIEGRGKAAIEIYFDTVLIARKQIDFETGAIYD